MTRRRSKFFSQLEKIFFNLKIFFATVQKKFAPSKNFLHRRENFLQVEKKICSVTNFFCTVGKIFFKLQIFFSTREFRRDRSPPKPRPAIFFSTRCGFLWTKVDTGGRKAR
jgi:hypothetical protein